VPSEPLAEARRQVDRCDRVLVLTGAGVSTDSGIPDFRGPDGVWTRDPAAERLSTLDAYMSDPEVRRLAWKSRLSSPTWAATPNAGHRALVDLEHRDKLELLVTQNIDGLHQKAGSDPDRMVEIHGTMRDVVCMRCGDRGPAGPTLERVQAGDPDPACLAPAATGGACGGILKSATISFGQQLVVEDLERSEASARRCDLLLAVGSSLAVHPAAGLVPLAAAAGAAVVIVNAETTPYDHIADAVVGGRIAEVLPKIMEGP
jgi:NAD-dependent deacetylase